MMLRISPPISMVLLSASMISLSASMISQTQAAGLKADTIYLHANIYTGVTGASSFHEALLCPKRSAITLRATAASAPAVAPDLQVAWGAANAHRGRAEKSRGVNEPRRG